MTKRSQLTLCDIHCARLFKNRIGGVEVSVLASSVVDRGFEPRTGHTKDNEIGIC